jgi:hypothetical protein
VGRARPRPRAVPPPRRGVDPDHAPVHGLAKSKGPSAGEAEPAQRL